MARKKAAFNTKSMLNGALAGLASQLGNQAIGPFGAGIGTGLVGFVQNDATLQTLGSYQLGSAAVSGGFNLAGIGNGGNGGGLL